MRQLDDVLRLHAKGARFKYYVMDCPWWTPDSDYSKWKMEGWHKTYSPRGIWLGKSPYAPEETRPFRCAMTIFPWFAPLASISPESPVK